MCTAIDGGAVTNGGVAKDLKGALLLLTGTEPLDLAAMGVMYAEEMRGFVVTGPVVIGVSALDGLIGREQA